MSVEPNVSSLRLLTGCVAACLVVGCAPAIQQFYTDTFHPEDHIYQNATLGFALMFSTGWQVVTDPMDMDKTRRQAAMQLHKQGAELIFAGETVEGGQGTRGIVENLNRPNKAFLAALRKANAGSITRDLGEETFMAGEVLSLKWEYEYRDMRFVEFLFRAGTYNVRIAFWTKPDLYESFLPEYEAIMATLDLDLVQ